MCQKILKIHRWPFWHLIGWEVVMVTKCWDNDRVRENLYHQISEFVNDVHVFRCIQLRWIKVR